MHACVLVLVPEDAERRRLASLLESQGHAPLEASDAQAALEVLGGIRPDLVVLSGACVSPWQDTQHGEGALLCIEPKADVPCLTPPYTRTQFLEAVRRTLGSRRPTLHLGDRIVDLHLREIRSPEGTTRLSPTECDFLGALADRRGRVVATAELVAAVWGHAGASTVSVTTRRVRNKIEPDPSHPIFLRTVHGVGLELHVPERNRAPREPLIGRDALIAQVTSAVAEASLVTLHGPPGVGASRLALAACPDALPVDLGTANTVEDITGALAAALTLRVDANVDPVQLLSSHDKQLLLDNVDQARRPLAELLTKALKHPSDARWIVTSHAPLGVPGEHVLSVPPLTVADAAAFLRAQVPGLEQAEAVAEALDGLPLALELAAPVLRTLGPAPLLETWATRFALLADDQGLNRLELAFETCWTPLPQATRDAMTRLAMAQGPLGMSDALELAGARPLMEAVAAGLAQREGSTITLLGAIRAFVLSQASDEAQVEAKERHLAWVQTRRTTTEDTLNAADFALESGKPLIAVDLLIGLEDRMRTEGNGPRWIRLLEKASDHLDTERHPQRAGTAFALRGGAALPKASVAVPLLERALALATVHQLDELALRAHTRLGDAALYSGDVETAATHFEVSASLAPDSAYAPFAHFRRAHFLAFTQTHLPQTDRDLENAVEAVRAHGFERMNTAMVRAYWLDRIGRGADAVHHFRDCLAVARRANDAYSLARFLCTVGGTYVQCGRARAAKSMLDEALILRRAQAHPPGIAAVTGNLAEWHALQGRLHTSERLLSDATTLFLGMGHKRAEAEANLNLAALRARARRLDDADTLSEKTLEQLERFGMKEMIAHSLHTRSQIAAAKGELDRASVLAAEALDIARQNRVVRAELAVEAWALSLLMVRGAEETTARAHSLLERSRKAGSFRLEGEAALALLRLTNDPGTWRPIVEQCAAETGDPTTLDRLAWAVGEPLAHDEGDIWVAEGQRTRSLLLAFDLEHLPCRNL